MKEYGLFPTTVWSDDLNLDLDELRKEIYKFSKVNPSIRRSNVNGYQGHDFHYEPLIDTIKNIVPRYNNPELGELYIGHKLYASMWVNINPRGAHNRRHTHADGIILLSGVYYVTVPKNSGNIIFFDPRPGLIHSFADSRYYGSQSSNPPQVYQIQPKENMILLFPCWLEHEVQPNTTNEDRISVSFNIVRKNDVDTYKEV